MKKDYTLYHGTSDSYLERIKKDGLLTPANRNRKYGNHRRRATYFDKNSVYLTTAWHFHYAINTAKLVGGDPIIIEVKIRNEELEIDEDFPIAEIYKSLKWPVSSEIRFEDIFPNLDYLGLGKWLKHSLKQKKYHKYIKQYIKKMGYSIEDSLNNYRSCRLKRSIAVNEINSIIKVDPQLICGSCEKNKNYSPSSAEATIIGNKKSALPRFLCSGGGQNIDCSLETIKSKYKHEIIYLST